MPGVSAFSRFFRLEPKELVTRDGLANNDTAFVWRGRLPGKGWYMLEFQLAEAFGAQHLSLRVDCGDGYDAALSVTLPLRRGKVAKRICYFPSRVKALELELFHVETGSANTAGTPAEYSIAHCRLAWLAPQFARDRLCQRLANMHRNFRGQPTRAVRVALTREAALKGRSWRALALMHYGETFHKRCPEAGYSEWLAQVEVDQLPGSNEVYNFLANLDEPTEFVMRLRLSLQTAEYALQALSSVLAQSYPHWKLVVEVCADLQQVGHPVIERFSAAAKDDARLVIVDAGGLLAKLAESGTRHQFFSELPASGRLHLHALYMAAQSISQNPDAQLLYTDADSLNRTGGREAPLFKPGWNPDLLLGYNYIGQCCFFERGLLRRLGSIFPAGQGKSVYSNLLHCRDQLLATDVTHIPRVLYHQKRLPEAEMVVLCAEEQQSLKAYLQPANGECTVSVEIWEPDAGENSAVARCRWALPEPAPLVSLLIPTRDGVEILRQCVGSILRKTEYHNFEILILDNQSRCSETLAYLESVQSDSRVRVYRWNQPFNYSAINNYGATLAQGSILGLINNDIEVITPDWLCEMVSHAWRDEIGCVGAKLYYGNDTVQHGGVILGIGGTAGHSHKYALRDAPGYMGRLQVVQNLSAVTGACLLLRKSVFDEVGGLNEKDLAVAYNDVDLCLKVREAGYRNLWTPFAELYHHESISRGADDTLIKRRRAQREADYMRMNWGEQLDSDPAYNPNLTLIHEDFSLG